MNGTDQKLLTRWLPRLEDRSDDVKITAMENLSAIALRNADQRNLIAPQLLDVAHRIDDWAVLSTGFLSHASAIPEFDATWAEDFFEAYLAIARKSIDIASRDAYARMLILLQKRFIDASSPLVKLANDLALEQLRGSGNEYMRDALFALTDWCEDHKGDSTTPATSNVEVAPFTWPSTNAPLSDERLGNETFPLEVGVLSTIGYAVGLTHGREAESRRKLLSEFFTSTPSLSSEHPQAVEWGAPNSAGRLLKLANTIAAHARNAKRRKQRPETAIADWESDLAFLKRRFFDGVFQFQWPSTTSLISR